MIETVLQATRDALQVMQNGRNQTQTSLQQTEEIVQAFNTIVSAVSQNNVINIRIASTTEQQSAVSEAINVKINAISQLAGSRRRPLK